MAVMTMDAMWTWGAEETAEHVRAGTASAKEVTEAHLARLDAVNPDINAVTFDVRESALAAAAELDTTFAASGPIGPLHGVAITIKENHDVEGQPSPNGVTAFQDRIAPADAPMVANLRKAGAIIVGRTNTPELSYRWHTDNPLRGETKNPWSPNRTPGGSSGGAAASLAAGIGTIAHGNDLGGSIRQPANCCGLVGLRPTLGRIPAFNPSNEAPLTMGLQLMSVQGPLTRSVADARLALEVMMQPSHDDPWHRAMPLSPAGGGSGRVALNHGFGEVDSEVRDTVRRAGEILAAAGYDVELVDPPGLEVIPDQWRRILTTEVNVSVPGEFLATLSAEVQRTTAVMSTGYELDAAGLVMAYARRLELLRSWTQFLQKDRIVVGPTSQRLPFAPNEDASSPVALESIIAGHGLLVTVNYLGLPSVAVPVSLDNDGPIGVQIIGAPFEEGRCLDAAAVIEREVGSMPQRLWDREAAS